jgi:hypothetical protein
VGGRWIELEGFAPLFKSISTIMAAAGTVGSDAAFKGREEARDQRIEIRVFNDCKSWNLFPLDEDVNVEEGRAERQALGTQNARAFGTDRLIKQTLPTRFFPCLIFASLISSCRHYPCTGQ